MIRQQMINECLNLVRMGNRKRNEIRSSEGESPLHRSTKEEICNKLLSEGHEIVTEAIFTTGGRADILILDQFKVIEIACSETDESLIRKSKTYPQGLSIEVVRTWNKMKQ